MLFNDIHSTMMIFVMHLKRVTLTEGLDKGLRLNLSLAGQLLLNISLQISTLLPTLKKRTKQPTKQPFNNIHENSGDRYSQVLSSKGLPDLAVTRLCMAVNEIHV